MNRSWFGILLCAVLLWALVFFGLAVVISRASGGPPATPAAAPPPTVEIPSSELIHGPIIAADPAEIDRVNRELRLEFEGYRNPKGGVR